MDRVRFEVEPLAVAEAKGQRAAFFGLLWARLLKRSPIADDLIEPLLPIVACAGAEAADALAPGVGRLRILAAVLEDCRQRREGALGLRVVSIRRDVAIDAEKIELIRQLETLDSGGEA